MLFPDQRIRRDRKQRFPIIRSQRAEPEPLALKSWLEIETDPAG